MSVLLRAGAAALVALALAACGSGDPADKAKLVPPPGTILAANSTGKLGTVVIDGHLNTLYRYDRDSANPPSSACVDDCAKAWPPLITNPAVAPVLDGVKPAAVGTLTRPDGSVQVTIGGWPVYRHAGEAAGAVDGNGADGVWFAITPDGRKAAAG